ncbi:MAG: class II aldolase [Caulobacterales bacterium]|nr:class II aldolase [Caulobacterales bacterium]
MNADAAPEDLVRVAAELGADPSLVQGAGGNSSLKVGDCLWVKASGRWMADALSRPVFVPLSLSTVRDRLARGVADNLDTAMLSSGQTSHLRPSIETTLHALMPQAAVLHAHALNSVTTSVLHDGADRFHEALGPDLTGVVVDYVRPGPPLALAVSRVLASGRVPDVILLRNHGVVVGADSPGAAAALLREVERRLQFPVRDLPAPYPAPGPDHETVTHEALPLHGGVAADPFLFDLLTRSVLVPDQAVFLGGSVCGAAVGEDIAMAAGKFETVFRQPPVLVLAAGRGAYGRRDRTAGADGMIDALMAIARRIPLDGVVQGLPDAEVAGLLGWDAEHFRRQLDVDRQ